MDFSETIIAECSVCRSPHGPNGIPTVDERSQCLSTSCLVVDFNDLVDTRWQSVNAVVAIGISADKNWVGIGESVNLDSGFGSNSRYLDQYISDPLLAWIENAIVVLIMENITLNRGGTNLLKVVIDSVGSAQRNANV